MRAVSEGAFDDALAALAEDLVVEHSTEEVLAEVIDLVAETLPRCDLAGITLLDEERRPTTAARTDPAVQDLDDAQYTHDDGPCLASLEQARVVTVEDIGAERRWQLFRDTAAQMGVRSTLAMPLIVRGKSIGALNCYSREVGPFGRDTLGFAEVCASRVAVTVANTQAYEQAVRLADDLRQALLSRDVIGQAKGLLMASSGLTSDQAFDMLRRASQRTNIKLHDIAADMVDAANARAALGGEGAEPPPLAGLSAD